MNRLIATLFALMFVPSLGWASGLDENERPESVRVTYAAPAECPTRERFMAQVASRVSIDWLANDDELARHIYITLEPIEAEFVAKLNYRDESGQEVTRSVQAPNCEQAVAGIALVCAIAIETRAARPDGGRDAVPTIHNAPGDQPLQTVRPETAPFSRYDSPFRGPRETPRRPLTYELGAHAGVHSGVGPVIAYGGGLDAGFGKFEVPTVRVAASWYESREDPSVAFLTSQFRLLVASLQVCQGQSIHADPKVTLALCAGGEVGQYRARGQTSHPLVFNAYSEHLFWAAIQLGVPLRVSLYGGFLEFQPLVRVPLTRGSFHIVNGSTDTTNYQVPLLAVGLNLGLGFPLGG